MTVVSSHHEAFHIFIGRPSIYGNPFPVTELIPLEISLGLYEQYARKRIKDDPKFKKAIRDTHGAILGCPGNCKPGPCHGDIIEKLAAEIVAEESK